MRHEPPVSVPIAISHMPSAAAIAAPDDEPPGMRARSAGLPGVPKWGFIPTPEKANSVMLVLATITAPAARSRRTADCIGRRRLRGGGERPGARARHFARHIEQVLDADDRAVERTERHAGARAGIGGIGGRPRRLGVDGEAGARAFPLRIGDAGQRLFSRSRTEAIEHFPEKWIQCRRFEVRTIAAARRTSNRKAHRIIDLLVPLASEVRVGDCSDVSRTSEAGHCLQKCDQI